MMDKKQDYSVFPIVNSAQSYLAQRAAGYVRCLMLERGEEMFSMIGALAVFAVLCVAALYFG